MARKFKTRNNCILEEIISEETIENKFCQSYNIIYRSKQSLRHKFPERNYIILLLNNNDFPKGGGWGDEWDIIKEIPNEKILIKIFKIIKKFKRSFSISRKELEILASFQCENNRMKIKACGNGALCNSCWAKSMALKKLK